MNITVVGAGNMGLAMAGYMTANSKGIISLYTAKEIFVNGPLTVKDVEEQRIYKTEDITCTYDPKQAFMDADIIFVTYPAFLRKDFIEKCGNYIKTDAFVGFVPGYGGIEYSCTSLLNRGVNVFGFQRVPYVARAEEHDDGRVAGILSKKSKLFIGAIPYDKTEEISQIVESLLDIPVQPLKEYLSITLAPSNPLLHITGLYNVFKDHSKDDIFDGQLKFYEEWNDKSSELLFAYDQELQSICKALAPIDMSEVVPLPVYYESSTPEEMTQKLKSIESFKAVMVPLKKAQNGYKIDLSSRMFQEDFPYGVCVIKDYARITGVKTPTVDLLLDFYYQLSGHRYFESDGSYTEEIQNTGVPGIYNLNSIDDVINFYHK